jgi:hypothetical protein
MALLFKIIGIWFGLNLAIPAFIAYQRSPHFRHRLFRLTLGAFTPPSERKYAHVLVDPRTTIIDATIAIAGRKRPAFRFANCLPSAHVFRISFRS